MIFLNDPTVLCFWIFEIDRRDRIAVLTMGVIELKQHKHVVSLQTLLGMSSTYHRPYHIQRGSEMHNFKRMRNAAEKYALKFIDSVATNLNETVCLVPLWAYDAPGSVYFFFGLSDEEWIAICGSLLWLRVRDTPIRELIDGPSL
jgi:hypothetical protein